MLRLLSRPAETQPKDDAIAGAASGGSGSATASSPALTEAYGTLATQSILGKALNALSKLVSRDSLLVRIAPAVEVTLSSVPRSLLFQSMLPSDSKKAKKCPILAVLRICSAAAGAERRWTNDFKEVCESSGRLLAVAVALVTKEPLGSADVSKDTIDAAMGACNATAQSLIHGSYFLPDETAQPEPRRGGMRCIAACTARLAAVHRARTPLSGAASATGASAAASDSFNALGDFFQSVDDAWTKAFLQAASKFQKAAVSATSNALVSHAQELSKHCPNLAQEVSRKQASSVLASAMSGSEAQDSSSLTSLCVHESLRPWIWRGLRAAT